MSSVYFALARHEYGSYADLRALIALSGYATCYIDEIDPTSDNAYIIPVRNGELPEAGYPDARARLIHWCFEWDQYPPLPGIAETWYPDVWAAGQYGGRYVPIGGDARLNTMQVVGDAPLYDAAFLAYMTGNRPEVRKAMMDKGISVSPTSAWGEERHKVLTRSKLYTTIHQFPDKPTMPVLRLVVAAAYRLPFITQAVHDVGVYKWGIMQSDLAHFADFVALWANDTSPTLSNYGHSLYAHLCEDFTFRQSVECAL
jgi:hypothetical protein